MKKFFCKDGYGDIICFFSIILTVLSIFAILWIRSYVIAIEYRLGQLEEKKKYLMREQKMLIAERASLTSLAKIEKGQLCYLNFPDRNRVVYISKNNQILLSKVSLAQRDLK